LTAASDTNFKEDMLDFNNEFSSKCEYTLIPAFKRIVDENTTDIIFNKEFSGLSNLKITDDLTAYVMEANKLVEYSKLRLSKLEAVLTRRQDNKLIIYKAMVDVFKDLQEESAAKLQRHQVLLIHKKLMMKIIKFYLYL
jgi:hypothetical protein